MAAELWGSPSEGRDSRIRWSRPGERGVGRGPEAPAWLGAFRPSIPCPNGNAPRLRDHLPTDEVVRSKRRIGQHFRPDPADAANAGNPLQKIAKVNAALQGRRGRIERSLRSLPNNPEGIRDHTIYSASRIKPEPVHYIRAFARLLAHNLRRSFRRIADAGAYSFQ